jgi:hypothetical protein
VEIPLVLSSPRQDCLVYALPLWFRVIMGFIVAVVVTALAMGDSRPGILAWVVLVLLCLASLYEEKWTFQATESRVTHRAGLLVAARSTSIDFASIDCFRIVPVVKGTRPGSADEKAENAAALKGQRVGDGIQKKAWHKKPFLSLEIECTDGTRYLIDHVPARRVATLRSSAARMAALCEKPVSEG